MELKARNGPGVRRGGCVREIYVNWIKMERDRATSN
jgi:hypothetical protein